MGVPKFFRYMSERYPCLSEYVKEYQIPEFDNLYLDMNGIIHMCSHPDDNNPHFRITEERIFADIFHYIEVLFRMIKPQKVFFMAVDGVAPRAKMNQQRGRRFRSAKDAEKMEAEAKKKGEVLPQEARFDSNCITPGTPFMAKLQEQLKYFVVNKISSDKMWRKCKVILSGHETPGEGEHKIMDYIRFIRSQPGYDPNTRHCLYGLDADLIMLGLCSHDPHFSLLREEVKFGKKSTKRNSVPEDITFFLLHLSLMREYLELEFAPLKTRLKNFAFDIEKVIDDWVLMGFLVGNDFIPHLPNLHIANGALPVLYAAYMDILPTLDGYINEGGFLNLQRFEKFMNKLGSIDVDNFEEVRDDLLYMEGKTGRKCEPFAKVNTKPRNLEEWSPDEPDSNPLFKESLEGNKKANPELEALVRQTEEMYLDSDDDEEEESDEDAFNSYKKSYYMNKMDYKNVTQDVLRDQAEGYVRAIQWNLHYYYNGVCSWSWYYPHHYSPYISDIKGFKDLKLEFQLGKPFKPYEQLLAVLPAASKNLLPGVYHDLMLGDDSPIKQFYPEEFDTDLNGKKQDWEAVVLVPFIDEKLLLQSMKTPNQMLTPEEVIRNKHGPMLEYQYTEENQGKYEAPAYFPDVNANFAKLTKLTIDDIRVPVKDLVKGAYPGVLMNVFYPGFPTMKHLTYTGSLKKAKVKVFEQPSRNESMIISLTKTEKYNKEKLPVELLGKTVYVGWPHLVEAKVVAVLNEKDRFISMGDQGQYNVEPTGNTWKQEVNGVTEYYKVRMGIDTGPTDILVKVKIMIGRRYCFAPNGRINLEKNFAEHPSSYPIQTIVDDISVYDAQHSAFSDIESIFSVGSTCFTLCNPDYGAQGTILEYVQPTNGRVKILLNRTTEPDFTEIIKMEEDIFNRYYTLYMCATRLAMSNYVFSRITGAIFIITPNNEGGLKNVNIGLDLKFNKKNLETPGYTKKVNGTWYYSDKAIDVVGQYVEKFPEVFRFLTKNSNQDDLNAEEVFSYDSDEKVKELQKWLRTLPCNSIEKKVCGSAVCEPEIVAEIEKIVDNFPKVKGQQIRMQIKPNLLFKPEMSSGNVMPDSNAEILLFDRVVNVREGFTVPLGLKGTVIAIHNSPLDNNQIYDVVFDSEFTGGMTLNCTPNRGYRLPKTAIICISHGIRLLQKLGRPGELLQKARAAEENKNKGDMDYQQRGAKMHQRPQNSAFASYQNERYQNRNQRNPSQASMLNNSQRQGPPPRQPFQNQPQSTENNVNEFIAKFANIPPQIMRAAPAAEPPSTDVKSFMNQFVNKAPQQPKVEPPLKKGGDFMPTFEQGPKPAEQKVDTDFLKKMLGIASTSAGKSNEKVLENAKKIPAKSETVVEENIPTIFILPKQEPPKPKKKVNYLVQLLDYYQANNMGLPRYQYFETGSETQSQITLPNRQVIIGNPGKTREEASENVARNALAVLQKTPATKQSPKKLPPVPKNWVQQAQQHNVKPQNNKEGDLFEKENKKSPKTPKSNSNNGDTSATKTLSNSFVPLQAVKQHINKNKAKESYSEAAGGKSDEGKNEAQEQRSNSKTQQSTSKTQKPKKPRQMRIAANFTMK